MPNWIETLLDKQQTIQLTESEEKELDCYAEIDDYLSFVNRTIRNKEEQKYAKASRA